MKFGLFWSGLYIPEWCRAQAARAIENPISSSSLSKPRLTSTAAFSVLPKKNIKSSFNKRDDPTKQQNNDLIWYWNREGTILSPASAIFRRTQLFLELCIGERRRCTNGINGICIICCSIENWLDSLSNTVMQTTSFFCYFRFPKFTTFWFYTKLVTEAT